MTKDIVVYLASNAGLVIPYNHHTGKKNHKGEFFVKRNLSFTEGRLELNSAERGADIKYMDGHMGNQANGGSSFRKQPEELDALLAFKAGEASVTVPEDGVMEADNKAFEFLDNIKPAMPPNTQKKVLDVATGVYDRFRISGIPRPTEKTPYKVLRASVMLMLSALQTEGIWIDNSEGEESS